jgi:hypothetical protein
MLRYIANRVLTIIPTLFVVSVVVFGLQQMLPGDAAIALAGSLDPAIPAQIRADRHLDRPRVVQHALWFAGVLHGRPALLVWPDTLVRETIETGWPPRVSPSHMLCQEGGGTDSADLHPLARLYLGIDRAAV